MRGLASLIYTFSYVSSLLNGEIEEMPEGVRLRIGSLLRKSADLLKGVCRISVGSLAHDSDFFLRLEFIMRAKSILEKEFGEELSDDKLAEWLTKFADAIDGKIDIDDKLESIMKRFFSSQCDIGCDDLYELYCACSV